MGGYDCFTGPAVATPKHRAGGRGGKKPVQASPKNSRFGGASASGRSGFPWINQQIIKASEYGDIEHLLSTVAMHLPYMNLVNLTTAVHRLAKLTANDPESQANLRRHPTLDSVLATILDTLGCAATMGESQSQSLSNIVWSLATMRLTNKMLIDKVAALAATRISFFKPFELSTLLWALAKLGAIDNVSFGSRAVFNASASHIAQHAECFGFRCLATTAWAFATARHRNAKLFRSIAAHMVPMVRSANPQEMANTTWAFATANFHDEQLFGELAKQAMHRLGEFKAQELSNMLWGFASNNFFHEAFYVSASMAARRMPLGAQHLANILCAFARVRPNHPATKEAMIALLPWCTTQLETFKPQEVSATLLAAAKVFGRNTEQGWDSKAVEPIEPDFVPAPVSEFFNSSTVWAMPRVRDFSAQSLANTLSAHTMLRSGGCANALTDTIGVEALRRIETLDAPMLAQLLRGFSIGVQDAAEPSALGGHVCQELATKLATRVQGCSQQEVTAMSRAWSCRGARDMNREELSALLVSLASAESECPKSMPGFGPPDMFAATAAVPVRGPKPSRKKKGGATGDRVNSIDDWNEVSRSAIEQDPAVLAVHSSAMFGNEEDVVHCSSGWFDEVGPRPTLAAEAPMSNFWPEVVDDSQRCEDELAKVLWPGMLVSPCGGDSGDATCSGYSFGSDDDVRGSFAKFEVIEESLPEVMDPGVTTTFKWHTSVKNSFVHVDIEVFEDGYSKGDFMKMYGEAVTSPQSPLTPIGMEKDEYSSQEPPAAARSRSAPPSVGRA
mmetsp:Transcript_122089/g.352895  ORF Transcript_122089/g.352895 Transcript_122089/m.352895 type:complete len:788 (+) Transcript_122089:168-2531(+)